MAEEKHPFRFEPGDRVHWRGFPGVRGTVERVGAMIYVKWDRPEWVPTAFPAVWDIKHCEETK